MCTTPKQFIYITLNSYITFVFILSIVILINALLYGVYYNSDLVQTECKIIDNRVITLSERNYCGQFKSTIKVMDNFCGNISDIWIEWKYVTYKEDVRELKRYVYDELKIGKIYKNCYYDNIECDLIFLEEKESEKYAKIMVKCIFVFLIVTALLCVIMLGILDIKKRKETATEIRNEKARQESLRERDEEVEILIPVPSAPVLAPPPPYIYSK